MDEARMKELLANHVEHLEACCSDHDEVVYCLLHCLGWTRKEFEDLGFGYLCEEDEDNE